MLFCVSFNSTLPLFWVSIMGVVSDSSSESSISSTWFCGSVGFGMGEFEVSGVGGGNGGGSISFGGWGGNGGGVSSDGSANKHNF